MRQIWREDNHFLRNLNVILKQNLQKLLFCFKVYSGVACSWDK